MKTAVLHGFSCSKVKILSICLKTHKTEIPTLFALHYVEIHSFTYKSNEKSRFACFFTCSKVKILSICLKTLKPKIPTLLALQYVEIQSFTYKGNANTRIGWFFVL